MRLVFVPVLWSDQLGQCWSWRNISVTLVTLKVIQEQGQKIHLFADGCQPYVAFFILKAQEFGHLITCALISAVYPNFKRKILFCFVRALAQKIFFFFFKKVCVSIGKKKGEEGCAVCWPSYLLFLFLLFVLFLSCGTCCYFLCPSARSCMLLAGQGPCCSDFVQVDLWISERWGIQVILPLRTIILVYQETFT